MHRVDDVDPQRHRLHASVWLSVPVRVVVRGLEGLAYLPHQFTPHSAGRHPDRQLKRLPAIPAGGDAFDLELRVPVSGRGRRHAQRPALQLSKPVAQQSRRAVIQRDHLRLRGGPAQIRARQPR